MRFRVLTLFPEIVRGAVAGGILGRGVGEGLISVAASDIRDFGEGRHRVVDDTPYGGGAGMVMKAPVVVAAIEAERAADPETRVVLMTPQGGRFCQEVAERYAALPSLTLVCGRYEGFDERVLPFVDEELSLGDFVMMGGEVAALAVIETVARLVPGVLGDPDSAKDDSHAGGLLEYPQYTRPREFRGMEVPEVLLSGNHAEIGRWRREKALEKTGERRPDLVAGLNGKRTGGGG